MERLWFSFSEFFKGSINKRFICDPATIADFVFSSDLYDTNLEPNCRRFERHWLHDFAERCHLAIGFIDTDVAFFEYRQNNPKVDASEKVFEAC
jgi:hypothetical protein